MAVGALPKLSELQTEFGLPAGSSFFLLNRGGSYVPDTLQNDAIGTTAAATYLSQFPYAQDHTVITQGGTGADGSGSWGKASDGSYGSITRSYLQGATINGFIYSEITVKSNVSRSFLLNVSGVRAKSFFTSVQLIDTSGDPLFTSASAAHSDDGSSTSWSWVTGTDYSFDWDGSGNQTLKFL